MAASPKERATVPLLYDCSEVMHNYRHCWSTAERPELTSAQPVTPP